MSSTSSPEMEVEQHLDNPNGHCDSDDNDENDESSSVCSLLLTPSPKRLRIAPWASRNPKPFVDPPSVLRARKPQAGEAAKLDNRQARLPLKAVSNGSDSHPVYESPPLDNSASSPAHFPMIPANRASPPAEGVAKETTLLHTLFPELCEGPAPNINNPTKVPTDAITAEVLHEHDPRTWEPSYVNPIESSYHNFTAEEVSKHPPLPVTPARTTRGVHSSLAAVMPMQQPNSASVSTGLRKLRVYSSRKRTRTVYQPNSAQEFRRIAGITTIERAAKHIQTDQDEDSHYVEDTNDRDDEAEPLLSTSEKESSNKPASSRSRRHLEELLSDQAEIGEVYSYNDVDDGNEVAPATSQNDNDNAALDCAPVFDAALQEEHSPIYHTRSHTARLALASKQGFDRSGVSAISPIRRLIERRDADLERRPLPGPAPRRIAPGESLVRANLHTNQIGAMSLRNKQDVHKQYGYQRILAYPHRRDDEDEELKPGYGQLEMGYIVPTPSGASSGATSEPDVLDERSIRELKLMILGRPSQTDFGQLKRLQKRKKGTNQKMQSKGFRSMRRKRFASSGSNAQYENASRYKPLLRLKKLDAIRDLLASTASEDAKTHGSVDNSKMDVVEKTVAQTNGPNALIRKKVFKSKPVKVRRHTSRKIMNGQIPLLFELEGGRAAGGFTQTALEDAEDGFDEYGIPPDHNNLAPSANNDDGGRNLVDEWAGGNVSVRLHTAHHVTTVPVELDQSLREEAVAAASGNALASRAERLSIPEPPESSSRSPERQVVRLKSGERSSSSDKRDLESSMREPEARNLHDQIEVVSQGNRQIAGLDYLSASGNVARSSVPNTFFFQLMVAQAPKSPRPNPATAGTTHPDLVYLDQLSRASILAPDSSGPTSLKEQYALEAAPQPESGSNTPDSLIHDSKLSDVRIAATQTSPQRSETNSRFDEDSISDTQELKSGISLYPRASAITSQRFPMPAQRPPRQPTAGMLHIAKDGQITLQDAGGWLDENFSAMPTTGTALYFVPGTCPPAGSTASAVRSGVEGHIELPRHTYGRQIVDLNHLYPRPKPRRSQERRRITQSTHATVKHSASPPTRASQM